MIEAPRSTGPDPVERTFCFVDLAGFTALTEAHGDIEAVALLDRFAALTRRLLGPGDELVKSIGDSVMLASVTPEAAVQLVRGVLAACNQEVGFPLPRAGAHHGSAIARVGDYLGGAVNLASRVTGLALAGQLLATAAVADAARTVGLQPVHLGSLPLRNVLEPVDLFEIPLDTREPSEAVDPVCRMRIPPDHAAHVVCHDGRDYRFCSLTCAEAFTAGPDRYTRALGG